MIFGKPHSHNNSITGEGLRITIGGQLLVYDSFDPKFRAMRHLKFQVIYDEYDLSRVVAVQVDKRQRFTLTQTHLIPMDIRSMQPEDHKYLQQVRQFNTDRRQEVIETYVHDNALVEEVMANAPLSLSDKSETAIKLMFTDNKGQQKNALQDAKGLKKSKLIAVHSQQAAASQEAHNFQKMQEEYLSSKTDINQYLD